MNFETENKKELITYEHICEEAFELTIDLMMKKYDVLSMTYDQLGNVITSYSIHYTKLYDRLHNPKYNLSTAYQAYSL